MITRDNNPREALEAIVARINNERSHPALHGFILTGNRIDDIYAIAMSCLNETENTKTMNNKEQIKLAQTHLANFIEAATTLTIFWSNTDPEISDVINGGNVRDNYPPYLPSFDEFVTDIKGWANTAISELKHKEETKTFDQFQASRQFFSIAEIKALESLEHIRQDDEWEKGSAGYFVYDKGCYIALTTDGKFWCPISNYDVLLPTIEDVEKKLYNEHYLYA